MLYNLINKEDYEYDLSLRDVRAVSKRDAVDRVSEKEEFERGDLFWIQTKRNAAAAATDYEDEADEYAEFENLLTQLAHIHLGEVFGALTTRV